MCLISSLIAILELGWNKIENLLLRWPKDLTSQNFFKLDILILLELYIRIKELILGGILEEEVEKEWVHLESE